jgi:hypothetical protein
MLVTASATISSAERMVRALDNLPLDTRRVATAEISIDLSLSQYLPTRRKLKFLSLFPKRANKLTGRTSNEV